MARNQIPRLDIVADADDVAVWQDAADAARLPLADWVRGELNKAALRVVMEQAAEQMTREQALLRAGTCPKCGAGTGLTVCLDPRQAGAHGGSENDRWFNVRCPSCKYAADWVLPQDFPSCGGTNGLHADGCFEGVLGIERQGSAADSESR